MKRSTSSALLLAALLSAGSINLASAAPGEAPPAPEVEPHMAQPFGPHDRVEVLFDSWNLDDSQRAAFEQAQQAYRDQRQALREQHEQRLADIFEEDQLKALRAMQRPGPGFDHGPGFGHGKPKHHNHGPVKQHKRIGNLIDALYTSWGLNDEQRAELNDAREQFMSEAKALRDQTFDSRDAKRDAFQALRKKHHQAMSDVLNDEQMAVLEQLKPAPRHQNGPGDA
ncbi:hypothetical protein DFO67_101168 [Modicisalibacter xianhensis]|uniref:LTXXQ motif family protein n=1 Tax=Modicisalibacter xianhensis TaxID=442341 RepID=A0A4R8GB72_9GAMM|nr:hypothetical protein [Halomonas xianhensis]TDX32874.1 hypothetical protein DFO67_101168 [Halomonas xianhensis]